MSKASIREDALPTLFLWMDASVAKSIAAVHFLEEGAPDQRSRTTCARPLRPRLKTRG